ncbi:hypothetical protein [Archangium lansingense]|uniref:Uncharacterized protein n=1 Tax=Archangium lansingense TaxID=2995310 RepID=A0ABT4AS00_9BACT|nr:hypothetical protein [Archangium lansinium]MCY1083587.1 hypothetical protein [Archangium lansinium]
MDTPTPDTLESFRELYELLTDYEGSHCFEDVLLPAIPRAVELLEPLQRYRHRRSVKEPSDEELWTLFALSVVNDHLLLPLRVSRREYLRFFEALGFEPFEGGRFSPVRHEIVSVGNWLKATEGIQLGQRYWPGLLFGELVFSRSAVDVFCHADFRIRQGIADRSRLYFTHQRMRRDVEDLSHGWGSNSRWRTSFRLDYEEREHVIFNAFERYDLAAPSCLENETGGRQELPIEARRELLMHRCFVSYEGPWDDWLPYRDTLAVRRSDSLWPLDEGQLVRVSDLDTTRE